jgi:hypothetical protein
MIFVYCLSIVAIFGSAHASENFPMDSSQVKNQKSLVLSFLLGLSLAILKKRFVENLPVANELQIISGFHEYTSAKL